MPASYVTIAAAAAAAAAGDAAAAAAMGPSAPAGGSRSRELLGAARAPQQAASSSAAASSSCAAAWPHGLGRLLGCFIDRCVGAWLGGEQAPETSCAGCLWHRLGEAELDMRVSGQPWILSGIWYLVSGFIGERSPRYRQAAVQAAAPTWCGARTACGGSANDFETVVPDGVGHPHLVIFAVERTRRVCANAGWLSVSVSDTNRVMLQYRAAPIYPGVVVSPGVVGGYTAARGSRAGPRPSDQAGPSTPCLPGSYPVPGGRPPVQPSMQGAFVRTQASCRRCTHL